MGARGVSLMASRAPEVKAIATFDAAFVASRTDDSVVKFTHGKDDDEVVQGEAQTDEMVAVAKYVRELGSKPHP